jgi:hypothetical protein
MTMRRSSRWRGAGRSHNFHVLLAATAVMAFYATVAGAAPAGGSRSPAVPAVRQPLTTDPSSPVAHDTETMALVAHAGRLFAATDQWEYASPSAAGQILVKRSRTSAWSVFEQTHSLRVQALDSLPIPSDQGWGAGHSLLITQAIVGGRSRLQWLIDRATSFSPARSFVLASNRADARAFGAHESGRVWAVYAGVAPTGILRGVWSRSTHTLRFGARPELTVAPPGSTGLRTQKVTGFADCAGALYVSINTKLFRRNDGRLRPGQRRWVLVYQAPPVGPLNSGLRGLTCIRHHGSPSLLVSTEGSGRVYRLDRLPRGELAGTDTPVRGPLPGGLVPTLEFDPTTAIRAMLASSGTTAPPAGPGSIGYVIAAYNNFEPITDHSTTRYAFGLEWHYRGACPTSRKCTPSGWDAAACPSVRSDQGHVPDYVLRCLGGHQFVPAATVGTPVRSGQAFVSVRTIEPSPFGDSRIYYGGYDCNFYPADGTAWIASSTLAALLPAGAGR